MADIVMSADDKNLFPVFLVNAEVLSVTINDGMVQSQLRVTEVLHGPETLLNQLFKASAAAAGQGGVGALVLYPPLEKGESGIWPVCFNKEGEVVVERDALLRESLLDLPCREKREEKRCEDVRSLAKAVNVVSKATPLKRKELLRTLTTNDVELVRRWAQYAKKLLSEE
ncbi:MAG TPA: hypothetical protein VJ508_13935 [Saprospiraceae bacterium]|nr:hypothetical protein [Saprospiraceae bacterium]